MRSFCRMWVAWVLFVCVLLAGCGGGSSTGSTGKAQLRVLNAFPDTSFVDVLLDGSFLVQNLGYTSSSAYQSISAASHTIAMEPSGSNSTIASTTLLARSGANYTVIGAGLSANPSLVTVMDDLSAPTSNDFKLRLINASPSGGALDLYITAPGASLNNIAPNIPSLAFPNASGYMSFAQGTFQIRITPSGSKAILYDSGALTLSNTQIRSVVVLDGAGGGPPLQGVLLADLN